MKKELPIAVVLLAIGCLMWFCQSSALLSLDPNAKNSNLASASGGLPGSSNDLDGARASMSPPTARVQQASFQTNAPPIRSSDSIPQQFIHSASHELAIQFLSDVSQQLADSSPLKSTLKLTGNLFGQSFSGSGNYYQMGQGTRKSRIQLTFGNSPHAPSVSQLCDGRFVYNLQSNGTVQSFEFVDLKRTQQVSLQSANPFSPAGWVATGGIATLFQQLGTAFNFGEPRSLENSDIVLRGSWDQKAIRQIVESLETAPHANSKIPWDDIPTQLPHAVEIVFSKSVDFNYFPKKITFFKFTNRQTSVEPSVTLMFDQPLPLHNADDRFFVIDSSNLESVDMTDQYIARIQKNRRNADSNVRSY